MINLLNKKEKYEGFSLVEMLITIVIMGVVMLTASSTLTTLIKISTVSSNKTRVRSESEFVLELVRRTVRNSNPSDVYIFDSSNVRKYDPEENIVVDNNGSAVDPLLLAAYDTAKNENEIGNEIHFRPYGYESWICIAYFQSTDDPNVGYILKTSAPNLLNQQNTCFSNDAGRYVIALNSEVVNIKSFQIAYTMLKDSNYLIRFDIEAEPTQWYLAEGAPVKRVVHRQAVVSTEGIVW
jgi:prepilin-type N-terminal cleavage/methylation domain-containing protein